MLARLTIKVSPFLGLLHYRRDFLCLVVKVDLMMSLFHQCRSDVKNSRKQSQVHSVRLDFTIKHVCLDSLVRHKRCSTDQYNCTVSFTLQRAVVATSNH